MKIKSNKITELLAEANNVSTANAIEDNKNGIRGGKITAIIRMKLSFFKTFIQNKEKFASKDRLVYSGVISFRTFLKELKLLKLNNSI